jgi:hypothetical protein
VGKLFWTNYHEINLSKNTPIAEIRRIFLFSRIKTNAERKDEE